MTTTLALPSTRPPILGRDVDVIFKHLSCTQESPEVYRIHYGGSRTTYRAIRNGNESKHSALAWALHSDDGETAITEAHTRRELLIRVARIFAGMSTSNPD